MVLPGSLGMIANILFGRPSYGRCLLESQLKEGCLHFCQHSLQHGVYQVLIQSHEHIMGSFHGGLSFTLNIYCLVEEYL